jgi:endonuclease/exonuclease/phosphatase family metal-dependent hydrolase
MKIIFLNSWYAQTGEPYYKFIKENSQKTDIFCLTEVHPEMFARLQKLLPKFDAIYERSMFDKTMGFDYGQAILSKGNIKVERLTRIEAFRNVYNDIGFAVAYKLKINGEVLYLVNVHGKSRPGTKLDTPARIKQSKKIIDSLKDKAGPKIIGGDFNLMPETRSVAMFEEAGYRNLIKDFGIKNTRNKVSWRHFENIQHFADFCFVSPEIKIKNFQVPYNEVSDHLPLVLDFSFGSAQD